jgi:hypothetical protein
MEEEHEQNVVTEEDSEDFELPTAESDQITIEITREEFAAFIGDNAEKYLTKFRKFYADGHDKFAFTWHWPAFFIPYIWMAYRKLYVWAFALILLGFVPFLAYLYSIVFGLTGNYLYYKHVKKKILKLKTTQTFSDSTQMTVALRKTGRTNSGAMVIALLAYAIIFLFSMVLQFRAAQ